MPYHVEVRRPRHHARLFNLDQAGLRRAVLDPWARGGPLTVGGQRWERRESALRILEGPEIPTADLSFGRGWSAAERSARDVTLEILRGSGANGVAVLAADTASWRAAAALVEELGLSAVEWPLVRRRLVAWLAEPGSTASLDVTAVVIVCSADPPDSWFFDAGLALGALGMRAVVVVPEGDRPPPPLRDLDALSIGSDPGELGERLRRAGCQVQQR